MLYPVYAEHCLKAGQVVPYSETDERPESDDFVWLTAEVAAQWATQPATSWIGRAGRAVLGVF